jgi:hypothetical protein
VYQSQSPARWRYDDANVRAALRFSIAVTAVGLAFLVAAVGWVSTCSGATADMMACGVPQRTLLAVGAPAILLAGGLRAFVATYLSWRRNQTWWAWQGAGWFLLSLTAVAVITSMPDLAGPAAFGG